jgi:hypothetical protein
MYATPAHEPEAVAGSFYQTGAVRLSGPEIRPRKKWRHARSEAVRRGACA